MRCTCLFLFLLVSRPLFAQDLSVLDRARVAAALAKGRVSNFVEQRNGDLVFDLRDCDLNDSLVHAQMLRMQDFFRQYAGTQAGYERVYFWTEGAKDSLIFLSRMDNRTGAHVTLTPEGFLHVLPYLTDIDSTGGIAITLRRNGRRSPLRADTHLMDLVAVMYRQLFPSTVHEPLTITVEEGAGPALKTRLFSYYPNLDWQWLTENVLLHLRADDRRCCTPGEPTLTDLTGRNLWQAYIGNLKPPVDEVDFTGRSMANVLAQIGTLFHLKYLHFIKPVDPYEIEALGGGDLGVETSLEELLSISTRQTPYVVFVAKDTLVCRMR